MAYPSDVAAALSGATLRQLTYWRRPHGPSGPLLVPQYGTRPRAGYSFDDVVALRTVVFLRRETSLQKIRRAVTWLREKEPERPLSSLTLRVVDEGDSIAWVTDEGQYLDLVRQPGQFLLEAPMDAVLSSFEGNRGPVVDLARPAQGLKVDPGVRRGFPVAEDTRVPYDVIADLRRDGMSPAAIADVYPGVSPSAAEGAVLFDGLVRQQVA